MAGELQRGRVVNDRLFHPGSIMLDFPLLELWAGCRLHAEEGRLRKLKLTQ